MPPPARVIRFADYPVTAWKNGRGVTREVISVGTRPDGTFGWRLSMADIVVDAPFSRFAGIERHLAVLAGGPLEIVVEGTPRRIEVGGAITTFAGDAVVSARPIEATVTDLNLMIDVTDWSGSLEVVSSTAHSSSVTALVAIRDGLRVRSTGPAGWTQDFELGALDCVLADGAAEFALESSTGGAATDPVAVLVMVERRRV